uniref:QcrA and Rieske domain-containing protein n=1 Tax=Trichocoleus desertorum TaxID=1481672 RepID=UPI0025B50E86|nr:ubiquinol-cytochrome c reductase iron-sulfur subunit [Trichocoleus desertorum]
MDRRTFLTWVGVSGIASSLPVAIAACSDKTTPNETALNSTTPASAARSDGFQAVGALDSKGELAVPTFASGPLLVVRNPASPESLVAVNPTCTHKACPVTWQAEQQVFFCACHDSKFAADGKALQGPATEPLKTYEAKLEGNTVLVKT